jgi:hypothetical protein
LDRANHGANLGWVVPCRGSEYEGCGRRDDNYDGGDDNYPSEIEERGAANRAGGSGDNRQK